MKGDFIPFPAIKVERFSSPATQKFTGQVTEGNNDGNPGALFPVTLGAHQEKGRTFMSY